MRGIHEGDLGGLTGAIRVQGLQQSLLSVSKLTEQHNACIVFTADKAYMIPHRHLAGALAVAGPEIATCDSSGLYRTNPETLESSLNRVRKRPRAKRELKFDKANFEQATGPGTNKGRPKLKRHRSAPTVGAPRALDSEEKQILILATSGDMALANIVADRTGVCMKRVRQNMAKTNEHWAHSAAQHTLLTCNECGRPGWPDCVCRSVGAEGGHSKDELREHIEVLSAYNYMDQPAENPAVLFHRRLGHLPIPRMLAAFREGDPGIPGLTEASIKAMPWCVECAACKSTQKGHPQVAKGRKRTQTLNAVIHTDTMERIIPSMAPGRFTRIQTFVDEASRFMWVEYFHDKKAESFMKVLDRFEKRAQIQHRRSVQWKGDAGTPVLSYFTDSAGEICGRRSRDRLADKGIELRLSVPHESQTNGIAERANRSVLDMTRILLHQSRLPLPFWALAMDMAVWLLNRSPTKALSGNRSPYEAYYGRKPERKVLRVFGSKCWVWIPKDQRRLKSKLMPTARAMVFCTRRIQRKRVQRFQSLGPPDQEGQDSAQPTV